VLWTDHDPTAPPEVGRQVAEWIPDSRFELITGAGHWPQFEKADEFYGDVLGLELREMWESSVCCGFGGSFAMDYPEVSSAILKRKLTNALETQSQVIVADNPGCLMQIKGGLHAQGSDVKAMHLMELIAGRLDGLRAR
jgi:Fe-S oxidoreductase